MNSALPGTPLDIPVPPQLEATVEYRASPRYFAMYWLVAGDEAMVSDGRVTHDGCWSLGRPPRSAGAWDRVWGYQAYVDHPLIAIALAGHRYDLGSSDST